MIRQAIAEGHHLREIRSKWKHDYIPAPGIETSRRSGGISLKRAVAGGDFSPDGGVQPRDCSALLLHSPPKTLSGMIEVIDAISCGKNYGIAGIAKCRPR